MTVAEIIEELAGDRVVERIIENVAHRQLNRDTQDLAQMIYLALLTYDEAKIIDLYENEELNYFIVAIVRNQYNSVTSPYYQQIKKFGAITDELEYE
jgi:hypothetical protein